MVGVFIRYIYSNQFQGKVRVQFTYIMEEAYCFQESLNVGVFT